MDVVSPSQQSLYRQATRAAAIGLGMNLTLGVVKLVAGLLGNSYALLSDSVNSLGDSFSSVVVLFALRVSQKPADPEHPYGHTKAETVAASSVALLIILSALFVAWEAIRRFGQPREMPVAWTLWIAGANVVIKEALYQYNVRVGRRTGSSAIVANAWDHRSDAFCSLAVLIGLLVVRLAGPQYAWVDQLAALIVVAAILWSGITLYRQSASELMDVQAEEPFVNEIRRVALQVDGVECVEQCRVRKSGLEFLVDIHIEVDRDMSVTKGHEIGHLVKDALLARFENLRDVLVHVEPHPNHGSY